MINWGNGILVHPRIFSPSSGIRVRKYFLQKEAFACEERRGTFLLMICKLVIFILFLFCEGEKIATDLEQECSIGSRGENHGDVERTKLRREAWAGI